MPAPHAVRAPCHHAALPCALRPEHCYRYPATHRPACSSLHLTLLLLPTCYTASPLQGRRGSKSGSSGGLADGRSGKFLDDIKQEAKAASLKGISKFNRYELVELLLSHYNSTSGSGSGCSK